MCLVLPNLEDPRKKAPTLVPEADAEPIHDYLRELGIRIPE